MESSSLVRISPDVVFRPLSEGGGVLLHLVTGSYHQVNGTGAVLCSVLVEGPATAGRLVEALAEAHPGVHGLHVDVEEFLADMQQRALFEVDESPSTSRPQT
jgi:hypothetical protein